MSAIATFGAGCFWGVEAAFRRVPGVIDTAVGYSGGKLPDPTYDDVCSGNTGHVEVVQVQYDPAQISYSRLLDAFWACHDPTQLNRQGLDEGTQYRSVIFYHTEEQHEAAVASKERMQQLIGPGDPIATEIQPAEPFYLAEDYHQRYVEKTGGGSCHI